MKQLYLDTDLAEIESKLTELLEARQDANDDFRDILDNPRNWPLQLFLAPERLNLLSWLSIEPNSSLLEIGPSYGSLAAQLAAMFDQVSIVETSSSSTRIAQLRAKHLANVQVHHQRLPAARKKIAGFDYIFTSDIFDGNWLERLQANLLLLKQSGTVLLALDNPLSLQYWSGMTNHRNGKIFDGIERLDATNSTPQYNRKQIVKHLHELGLTELYFYYPVPNHCFPVEVFSEFYQPSASHPISSRLLPTPSPYHKREQVVREELAMKSIIEAGQFEEFANSFLILAKRSQA